MRGGCNNKGRGLQGFGNPKPPGLSKSQLAMMIIQLKFRELGFTRIHLFPGFSRN